MKTKFSEGDRISVSSDFYWAKGAIGTITKAPEATIAITGPWDNDGLTRHSPLHGGIAYWVIFDEPQMEEDGSGPYSQGSIPEFALSLV